MPKKPLTVNQRTAAQLRGRGLSIIDTAKAVGVCQMTVQRWGKRADFQIAVEKEREEHFRRLWKQEQERILREQSQEVQEAHKVREVKLAQERETLDETLTQEQEELEAIQTEARRR